MKKILWKTLNISFGVGEVLAEKDISLEKGERIVAAIATSIVPTQLVDLGLFENGNEVSVPSATEFWKRSDSGQYLDGFKPIEYRGGSTISARLTTKVALVDAVDVQIVFGIIKSDLT
jgi:hypothetical protein